MVKSLLESGFSQMGLISKVILKRISLRELAFGALVMEIKYKENSIILK
jgi:hypothetical protein